MYTNIHRLYIGGRCTWSFMSLGRPNFVVCVCHGPRVVHSYYTYMKAMVARLSSTRTRAEETVLGYIIQWALIELYRVNSNH